MAVAALFFRFSLSGRVGEKRGNGGVYVGRAGWRRIRGEMFFFWCGGTQCDFFLCVCSGTQCVFFLLCVFFFVFAVCIKSVMS